jgi:alkylation response protein AidB-like acyl-CoA dehydrogenase
MEFGFNDAQRDLHARMQALGARALAAPAGERLRVLAEGGALGLSIPREHGGGGFDLVTTAHAYEGLGRALPDGGVLLAAGAHLFGVAMMIAKAGTDEQKARWLPKLATGEVLATVCATEEGSGSDVAAAQTLAEPLADGGFRVTGRKRYVTAAARAGLYFVIARNGGDPRGATGDARATSESRGLVALLVPRETSGVAPGEPLAVAGLRNAELAPVAFDGAEVGASALVGRAGAGLAVFQIAMTYERAMILAFRLGAMEAQLRESVAFARTRRLGDTPIAKHQAVAHRVARMKLRLETARLLTYRAAWALDRGERAQSEAALAKWHVASAATESALDAIKLRGGAGLLSESGLVQVLDETIGNGAHSGTEDVLANIVAGWMGL